ncbi:MAG: AroM family protein [Nocardiopsaceae bacterium]|jgi:protein AroM|nr:AroM family protein [Nocardiopsaceae bacterium]
MPALGVVTIGQSPRADLAGELAAYLPTGTSVLERGALDNLTSSAIAALAPGADEDTLTSRLRNGESVVLDRQRLVPRLEAAISVLEQEGTDVNLLVCTGTFPPLRHRRPLLDAEHLLVSGVSAVAHSGGPLGVVVPLPAQQDVLSMRWQRALGASVLVGNADPYADAADAIPAAVGRLASQGARMALLDCMGYAEASRKAAAARTGIPVLLARSVVGRLAGEILCASAGR